MADTKTTDESAAATLTLTDVLAMVQSGADVKATVAQLVTAAQTLGLIIHALNSAAPNATIKVHSFAPNTTDTSADVALSPKGNGALLGQVPTNSAAGGNKRGTSAVDLQLIRASATSVGSGDYSFIGGGYDNKAAGYQAVVCGGSTQSISSGSSNAYIGGGDSHAITASYTGIVSGRSNTASGISGFIGGGNGNTVSATFGHIIGGQLCTVSTQYGAAHGYKAITRSTVGAYAYAGGVFSGGNAGNSQRREIHLRAATTDATQTDMAAENEGTFTNFGVLLPAAACVFMIDAKIVGLKSDGSAAGAWTISRAARRTSTTGSVVWADTSGTADVSGTAVGSGVPGSWSCLAHLDNINNAVVFRVTGVAATNIRWMANIISTEVTYE